MNLEYKPTLPAQPFPILIIGAGGIVKDAHLPAYRLAGFPVWGLYNRTRDRAATLAKECGIANRPLCGFAPLLPQRAPQRLRPYLRGSGADMEEVFHQD